MFHSRPVTRVLRWLRVSEWFILAWSSLVFLSTSKTTPISSLWTKEVPRRILLTCLDRWHTGHIVRVLHHIKFCLWALQIALIQRLLWNLHLSPIVAFMSLSEWPVLVYPVWWSTFIYTGDDTSNHDLGALSAQQQRDNQVHPVAFALHSLRRGTLQQKIDTLGLAWAVKFFQPYNILGHQCIVFTDHAACILLLVAKTPSSKQVRWALSTQELHLDIHHNLGKSNCVADALWRYPLL